MKLYPSLLLFILFSCGYSPVNESEEDALKIYFSFKNNPLNQSLLVEAGTGVGKSLAYLIPGILHSVDSERPFIISSQTITLQEQIRSKDLKICQQLFKQEEQ